jgi:thiamine transport system ATP-binding protein
VHSGVQSVLKLDSLSARFSDFECCFDLEIRAGERVALIGESGSGKTTLLNLVAGFRSPDSGCLQWFDTDLLPLAPHRRPVTTLFQDNNLFTHLSVYQNLAIAIDPRARLAANDRKRVTSVLERVGLENFESRTPPSLSGGQQQRIALARCLLRKQPLLLLDEPFASLDQETRQKMLALTDELVCENRLTLLLVTHDRDDVAALRASEIVCDGGRLYPSIA